MQCENFEIRIQELLDQRKSIGDPSLHEHAEHCSSCRETLAGYEALLLGLDIGPPPLAPPLGDRFADGVIEQLSTDSQSELASKCEPSRRNQPDNVRRPTSGNSVLFGFGTLVLVIAILVALLPLARNWLDNSRLGDAGHERPITHRSVPKDTVEIRSTVPPAADGRESPGPQAAPDRFATQPVHPPEVRHPETVLDNETPFDLVSSLDDRPTSDRLRTAVREWASRFPADEAAEHLDSVGTIARPITSSFSIAIGALRKTIPVGREPARPGKPQADASPSAWNTQVG